MKFLDWRALGIAILVAGTAFLAVMLLLTPTLFDVSTTLVLKYMASLLMGPDVITQEATTTTLVVGVLVNYLVAAVWGFIICASLHRWGLLVGIVLGGLLGLALYAINLYGMTFYFEWFRGINTYLMLAAHVLYGMVLGGTYEMFDHYDMPLVAKVGETA